MARHRASFLLASPSSGSYALRSAPVAELKKARSLTRTSWGSESRLDTPQPSASPTYRSMRAASWRVIVNSVETSSTAHSSRINDSTSRAAMPQHSSTPCTYVSTDKSEPIYFPTAPARRTWPRWPPLPGATRPRGSGARRRRCRESPLPKNTLSPSTSALDSPASHSPAIKKACTRLSGYDCST